MVRNKTEQEEEKNTCNPRRWLLRSTAPECVHCVVCRAIVISWDQSEINTQTPHGYLVTGTNLSFSTYVFWAEKKLLYSFLLQRMSLIKAFSSFLCRKSV